MTIKLAISKEVTEEIITNKYYRNGYADPYGQKMDDLNIWVCFNAEVEAWVKENIRAKSRLKLRQKFETVMTKELQRTTVLTTITFGSNHDAILFKMRWT